MSNPFIGYRDASRTNYGRFGKTPEQKPDIDLEAINCGSLQRIADATEKIAYNYDRLLREKKAAEDTRDRYAQENDRLRRRIAGLRGYLRRLKGGAS